MPSFIIGSSVQNSAPRFIFRTLHIHMPTRCDVHSTSHVYSFVKHFDCHTVHIYAQYTFCAPPSFVRLRSRETDALRSRNQVGYATSDVLRSRNQVGYATSDVVLCRLVRCRSGAAALLCRDTRDALLPILGATIVHHPPASLPYAPRPPAGPGGHRAPSAAPGREPGPALETRFRHFFLEKPPEKAMFSRNAFPERNSGHFLTPSPI